MDQQDIVKTNVTKQASGNNPIQLIVTVLAGVILFTALVYTNLIVMRTKTQLDGLNKRVAELSDLSEKLDQVINTGANDKILGFDKVDKDAFQSVFLSNQQVYFGKITEITTANVILDDVYYLRDGGSNQSLAKLGCEIHKPQDRMTIVRSNLQFWENLKVDDTQGVTAAIKQYEAANPNGQKCSS